MSRQGLRYSIRNQILKDHVKTREDLFRTLINKNILFRILFSVLEKLNTESLVFIAVIYGACSRVRKSSVQNSSYYFFSVKNNEARILEELKRKISSDDIESIDITKDQRFDFPDLNNIVLSFRLFRPLRRIVKKYPYFVTLRASRTFFMYSQILKLVDGRKPKAFIFSTDGNPYGSALMGVSIHKSIPSLFFSHAPMTEYPEKLKCDLAVFWGNYSLLKSLEKKSEIPHPLLLGFSDLSSDIKGFDPQREKLRCGIFLSKNYSTFGLKKTISHLRSQLSEVSILIRHHPDTVVEKFFGNDISISSDQSLMNDVQSVDFVLAGNTSVHLECFLYGTAAYYSSDLEITNKFELPYIKEKFVEPLVLKEDLKKKLEHGLKKYSSAAWKQQLAQYFSLKKTREESLEEISAKLFEITEGKSKSL